MASCESRTVLRVEGGETRPRRDRLISESGWLLRLNGVPARRLHCTPAQVDDLAVGYALTRRIIGGREEVAELEVDEARREISLRTLPAAPAAPPAGEAMELSSETVFRWAGELGERAALFRETGAAHCVALAGPGGLLLFREDVARRNALDKTVGAMVRQGLWRGPLCLLFSGRVALDMVEAVCLTPVRTILAVGAPTLEAVELAGGAGITLCGFIRGSRMNIYAGGGHIL